MAPKKKGGKVKSGGAGGIIDGVDTSQMSREQLEVFCHRIREENEREREERNFFQIERDKLRNFWEITKNELEEVRAKLRNKDRQVEEANENNEEQIKFYKQEVKHLKYEHQNNLTECKAEAMVALKMAQDEHIAQERELLEDIQELKKQIREQETAYQDLIKSLKLKHSEELSEVKDKFESKAKETQFKYSQKFSRLIEELEVKRKMELSEVEERKNCQISALINDHEKAFNEMKNYYNDITLNNLALISSLKDQMSVLKNQSDEATKAAVNISSDNRKLTEPLQRAENEVTMLKKQLENYKKDKLAFANTKAKLYDLKKEFDSLRWSNEVLQMRFEKLQTERNELYNKFVQAVLEVQQKTSFKNAHLQRKIQILSDVADYRESVIEELSATSELPPQHKKFEAVLSNKNVIIKNLKDDLSQMCQAYNELLLTYQQQFEDASHEADVIPRPVPAIEDADD